MQRFLKVIGLVMTIGLLVACSSQAEEFEHTALAGVERTNAPVTIPEDTTFLTMNEDAKGMIYESLYKIGTYAEGTQSPVDYSQIEAVQAEADYIEFLQMTSEQASLLYIGFDECPWCKAFSPKINQIASELNVPIYYYNTRAHEQDATFQGAMQTFGVETVPYVLVMEDGEAKERISHESSMEQIEQFFTLYTEEYQ
ncbi:thioredoxin family protein [Ruoffia tabacinasalis]|uniref:Thioredoxin family protein n=1 Tax=Ruoffia tabacinasalis TaxID=87458 RepID=A0ABS0LJQ0_9LACT|nr:thioredoxin family protein [Ruoffia tabacinasalis]MBG9978438.1 thioredoxin family protein [Ruoffia tabacinasalis]